MKILIPELLLIAALLVLSPVDPLPGCYVHEQGEHVTHYRCP